MHKAQRTDFISPEKNQELVLDEVGLICPGPEQVSMIQICEDYRGIPATGRKFIKSMEEGKYRATNRKQ